MIKPKQYGMSACKLINSIKKQYIFIAKHILNYKCHIYYKLRRSIRNNWKITVPYWEGGEKKSKNIKQSINIGTREVGVAHAW
jgi:hypothetical protein